MPRTDREKLAAFREAAGRPSQFDEDANEYVPVQRFLEVKAELDRLLSSIKVHRAATEQRLLMLGHREPQVGMLKVDRALYDTAEEIEAEVVEAQH